MELALITPPASLEMAHLLPGRFCIASIAGHNEEYCNWFATQQTLRGNVMLDNGVFEDDSMPEKLYSQVVSQIRPKVLIAHDIINDDCNTNYERAAKYALGLKEATKAANEETAYEPEIMFVLQTAIKDAGHWGILYDVLQKFLDNENLKWIGICRDLAFQMVGAFTGTDNQEINRLVLCTCLETQGKWISRMREAKKKIHFLGIGDNVNLLQYAWYVDSADTASFLWQASIGNTIGGVGVLYTKYKRPYNYFENDFGDSKEVWAAISHNCYEAQRYAQMAKDLRRQKEGGRL